MAFRPRIAPGLKLMDKRLFGPAPMNLRADLQGVAQMAGRTTISGPTGRR